jgi:hypothetical protein
VSPQRLSDQNQAGGFVTSECARKVRQISHFAILNRQIACKVSGASATQHFRMQMRAIWQDVNLVRDVLYIYVCAIRKT